MSANSNPFNVDMTKLFNVDPQNLMNEWRKSLESVQVPGVDMQAVFDSQRKNVEAVTKANQIAFAGVQAVMQRQAEILQQSVEEASKLFQGFDVNADPAERLAKQTALTQEAFEKALANMKELAELASKSQAEALEAIQKRFNESLVELKAQAAAAKK
ncbi:MAG TPA: phasin family protein [Gammaproteobacteria bacterium]